MKGIPPAGPSRVLALAYLAGSVGDGAYYVTSALYFTRVVGLSPGQIGFGLTAGWAVGSVVALPLGQLADRRGPRGVAVPLAVATAVSLLAFLLVHSFVPFILTACLYGSCQSGLAAARQALLAGLVGPAERTRLRAYLQSTVNAGLGLGAALGGVALSVGTREAYLTVFAVDALSFLASAAVLMRLSAPPPVPPPANGPSSSVLKDRPYALVTLINTVMLLYMPLLSLVLPLWIARRTAAPAWTVSALFVLNTVSVVLFQVRAARQVTGTASASRQVRRAGVVLLAACGVFALSASGGSAWIAGAVLVAAAVLQVIGEMLLGAGLWEIGFALAPADRQGQYQGFFGTGTAIARMLGPLLLTTLIIGWGPPGWLVLGGVFLLAGSTMTPAVRWAERDPRRSRTARPEESAAPPDEPGLSQVTAH
jgi:MFS family permease